jgi:hypothetical protein
MMSFRQLSNSRQKNGATARGVLSHGTRIDPDLRYPPYDRARRLVAAS